MPNAWVEHIKKYAKDNNLSYVCALSTPECKNTYVKSTPKQKTKNKSIESVKPTKHTYAIRGIY